jgi:hypothetical protein
VPVLFAISCIVRLQPVNTAIPNGRSFLERTELTVNRCHDPIRLGLARDESTGIVMVQCSADAEAEGKIDLLVSLAQSYRLTERTARTDSCDV